MVRFVLVMATAALTSSAPHHQCRRGVHTRPPKEAGLKTSVIVNFATNFSMFMVTNKKTTWTSSRIPNKRRRRHLRAPRLSLFCLRSIHTVSSQPWYNIKNMSAKNKSGSAHEALVSVRSGTCPSLRSTNRRCEEEGRVCNPSSTEGQSDVPRTCEEEGGVQSFFLRGSRGRRRGRHTRPTHNRCKHPELCDSAKRNIKTSRTVCDKRTLTCTSCQDPSVPAS